MCYLVIDISLELHSLLCRCPGVIFCSDIFLLKLTYASYFLQIQVSHGRIMVLFLFPKERGYPV